MRWVGLLGLWVRGLSACSRLVSRVWTGPGWAVGHPFAARGSMECYDNCGRSGSIRGGDWPRGGRHDLHDPVGLENAMQRLDLRSSCVIRSWIIVGCCY